jgi:hypothetical protein
MLLFAFYYTYEFAQHVSGTFTPIMGWRLLQQPPAQPHSQPTHNFLPSRPKKQTFHVVKSGI